MWVELSPQAGLLVLTIADISIFVGGDVTIRYILTKVPLILLDVSNGLGEVLGCTTFFLALLLVRLFVMPELPIAFNKVICVFTICVHGLLPYFVLNDFLVTAADMDGFLTTVAGLQLSGKLAVTLTIALHCFPAVERR